jgi:hypothetical protein
LSKLRDLELHPRQQFSLPPTLSLSSTIDTKCRAITLILNACFSEVQADAISQHIKYVIGMNKAIGDTAAIEFSIGFYDALGAGETYEKSIPIWLQRNKLSKFARLSNPAN